VVYLLGEDNPDTLSYGYKELDGDIGKVEAIDLSKDGGTTLRIGAMVNRGRPVHGDHMPTKIMREGQKRPTPDVVFTWSMPLVNDAFRETVERFEPAVHQFFPVDILWKDGSLAGKRYFLVVCNRLDSVHRDLTTMRFNGVLWEPVPGGNSHTVFDKSKFAGKHLWRDKHLISAPLLSNELAQALREAGITGIKLKEREEA
jgi:hypothetical protein